MERKFIFCDRYHVFHCPESRQVTLLSAQALQKLSAPQAAICYGWVQIFSKVLPWLERSWLCRCLVLFRPLA